MPVTKPCVLLKDPGLLARIISIKDPLSDMKQVGSLTRFFKLNASNRFEVIEVSLLASSKSLLRSPASIMLL